MIEAGDAAAIVVTFSELSLRGPLVDPAGRRTRLPRVTLWTLLETRDIVPEENHGR